VPYKVNFQGEERSNVPQLAHLFKQTHFCQVLAQKFSNPEGAKAGPATIEHLPWMVPVVGSGALDSIGSWEISLEHLLADIKTEVDQFGDSPENSESFATIADRFVRSLVKGRRRVESNAQNSEQIQVGVTRSAARLVLVTALLTRYVHVARAMGPTALDRTTDEIIETPAATASVDDPYQLATTIRFPLLDQLDCLMSELTGDEKFGALVTLLDAVKEALDQPVRKVSLNSLRLLTEATWVKLVDRPDAYYGWSELMLKLFLDSNSQGTHSQPTNGQMLMRVFDRRPRNESVTRVAEIVHDSFKGPTEASWRATTHSPVHHAVARVLISEAAQTGKLANRDLPRAMAISTAFDLELEMALYRAGSGFQIAIPLHAVGGARDAELVWMVGTVDPKESNGADPLDVIRNPKCWVPLSSKNKLGLLKRLPLIVRASGCPLITVKGECTDRVLKLVLPMRPPGSLQKPPPTPYDFNEGAKVLVNHAVIVDEYLAIRLAEAEIQRAYESQRSGIQQVAEVASIGQAFDGSSKNDFYFAFFGVPFGDPAVRQRLMSLLTVRWIQRATRFANQTGQTSRSIFGPTNEPSPRDDSDETEAPDLAPAGPSTLSGIAINTRLNLEEAFLLSSLGLSVVHGDCADFVPELLDYASHVSDEHEVCHPIHANTCTVRDAS